MRRDPITRPSFSRNTLPAFALLALAVSLWLIVAGLPDRTLAAADKTPPKSSKATGSKPSVAASGIVEPSSEITDVGTNVPGIVTEVYVQIGQRVKRGAPLFVIDRRQVQANAGEANAGVREAQAQIAEAQTTIRTSQRQLSLYRSITDQRAVSAAEIIAAEGTLASARARLQAAQAQLSAAHARRTSASIELARHIVYAPISGEILGINIHPGEYAGTGAVGGALVPYMQIGETQPLYVRIDVDENEASRISPGADAIISPRGNAERHLRVSFVRIEPQIVPKRSLTNAANERVDVRVLQLIYAVPTGETGLRVGQQIDAFIFTKERK